MRLVVKEARDLVLLSGKQVYDPIILIRSIREFGLTLLFNLGIMTTIAIVSNFNQVKGIPAGYSIPLVLAVTGGLIVGTNSFVAGDLNLYSNVREAMALGQTIGGVETLGFILVIASTVKYGVYQYRSWWR